jgi:predicted nuclease with TOPRIM domain
MDIDDLKKGLEALADSIESVQENLCDDFENLTLEEVGDRLSTAESNLIDVTGYTGRGMAASDRISELAKEFSELEEEKEVLEGTVKELEDRIEELENGQ